MELKDISNTVSKYKHEIIATSVGASVGVSIVPTMLNGADNPKAMMASIVASQFALVGGAIHSAKKLESPSLLIKSAVAGLALSGALAVYDGTQDAETPDETKPQTEQVVPTLDI